MSFAVCDTLTLSTLASTWSLSIIWRWAAISAWAMSSLNLWTVGKRLLLQTRRVRLGKQTNHCCPVRMIFDYLRKWFEFLKRGCVPPIVSSNQSECSLALLSHILGSCSTKFEVMSKRSGEANGEATVSVPKQMAPQLGQPINVDRWIAENKKSFIPPVCNKLMWATYFILFRLSGCSHAC